MIKGDNESIFAVRVFSLPKKKKKREKTLHSNERVEKADRRKF